MPEPIRNLTLEDLQAILDQLNNKAKPDMAVRSKEDSWAADAKTREKTGEGNVTISRRLVRTLVRMAAKGLDQADQ
jgi:hypothetical protein